MPVPEPAPFQRIPILHIITRLIVGGAQENTLYTALLLDHEKYDIEVLTGPQTGSEGSLIGEGRSKGIKITILPSLVRQVNPVQDLIALWQLVRYIRKNRFRIVHTHSSKAGILGRIAAKIAGAPVILHTVHGWSFHAHMPKVACSVYILLERVCARFTNGFIVVTNQDEKKGLAAGIGKKGQYHSIRSAIPLEEFNPTTIDRESIRKELGIPLDAHVVGTVGRLSAQKNPLEWIDVAEMISKELPGCFFIMVGDGPLRSQAEASIHEKGLSNQFLLTGIQRNIPQMMSVMDIFLLTSRWEGLPRVIPQAMSMLIPVIATSVDGSSEIIVDGVNGYLCSSGDVNCLASRCLNLLKDTKARQAIIKNGYETAVKDFDLKRMIAQIDDLYSNLLE
jgi:glycosyltransferase involved in cell wall biosynthesis